MRVLLLLRPLAGCAALALAGCAALAPPLPDQRSLQGAMPRPAAAVAAPAEERVALLRVVPGTPPDALAPPIERAVGAALAVRPLAAFDVVGALVARGNAAADQAALARLAPDLGAVAAALGNAGVPSSRIAVSARVLPGAGADEIRVFLR